MLEPYEAPAPPIELMHVGIDLDGTLAKSLWSIDNQTSTIGEPIWENIEKLNEIVVAGYKIYIYTARGWSDLGNIKHWLEHWNITYHGIICGKPLFRFIIDDRCKNAIEENWL